MKENPGKEEKSKFLFTLAKKQGKFFDAWVFIQPLWIFTTYFVWSWNIIWFLFIHCCIAKCNIFVKKYPSRRDNYWIEEDLSIISLLFSTFFTFLYFIYPMQTLYHLPLWFNCLIFCFISLIHFHKIIGFIHYKFVILISLNLKLQLLLVLL